MSQTLFLFNHTILLKIGQVRKYVVVSLDSDIFILKGVDILFVCLVTCLAKTVKSLPLSIFIHGGCWAFIHFLKIVVFTFKSKFLWVISVSG